MAEGFRFFESGLHLLNADDELKAALAKFLQSAAESSKSTSASLCLLDSSANVLKPAVTYGLSLAYVEACGHVAVGDQCCGRAVEHCKPWVVTDMLTDPLFASARKAAVDSPIRAAFSVPILAPGGKCLGSLACHYSATHVATNDEIARNETWATLIAHLIAQHQPSVPVVSAPIQIETRIRVFTTCPAHKIAFQ
jgi:GAF domain-containing protein